MNIDLVYYFREVNHFYYLNGPEKVNGNIENNSPSYQISSADDVVPKINQMIASLAPDITNVVLVSSESYSGNIQINTYRGELNVSSDVPDYTQVLTDISNNIKNLLYTVSSNISSSSNIYNTSSLRNLANLIYCFSSNISSPANTFNTSLFNQISSTIKSLNNNIHNDLTNINTTAENKDNVLIVDGQQTFKIRNSDEEI